MAKLDANPSKSEPRVFEWADKPPDDLHVPVIWTDGGPFVLHDYACPLCLVKPAVRVLHEGLFQPCWECQQDGWRLVRRRRWRTKK